MPTSVFDLHFDFSYLDLDSVYTLSAHGKKYVLQRHDEASLNQAKQSNPALAYFPEGKVTHYVRDVTGDPAKIQMIRVYGPENQDDIPSLDAMALRVDGKQAAKAFIERTDNSPYKIYYYDYAFGLDVPPVPQSDLAGVVEGLATIFNAVDTAKALVFLHPGISTLTPESSAITDYHIAQNQNLSQLDLALAIENSNGTWNTRVPLKDEDGNRIHPGPGVVVTDKDGKAVLGNDGQPVKMFNVNYRYDLGGQSEIDTPMTGSISDSVKAVNNDAGLEGARWKITQGKGAVDSSSLAPVVTDEKPPAADEEPVSGGIKYQLKTETPTGGVTAKVLKIDNDFNVTVKFSNSFVRHLSIYSRYLGADGETTINLGGTELTKYVPKELYTLKPEIGSFDEIIDVFFGTQSLQYIGTLSPENEFLGVPISSYTHELTFQPPTTNQTIKTIRLTLGSLGVAPGTNPGDLPAVWMGAGETLILDMAIPTISLATGVGESSNSAVGNILSGAAIVLPITYQVYLLIKDIFESPDNVGYDLKGLFEALAGKVVSSVLASAEAAAKLAAYFGAEEVAEAIPIAGWGLKAQSLIGTAAQLSQTLAEVISSPMVLHFDITLSMPVRVTITPDPRDKAGFPATAASLAITGHYTENITRTKTEIISTEQWTQSEISVEMGDTPVGGKVFFTVAIYSKEGWLVGKATSNPVDNVVGPNGFLEARVQITEVLYPLHKDTTYDPLRTLVYANGKHQWKLTDSAPKETVADLKEGQGGAAISAIDHITISSDAGILGYTWRGSGQSIPLADKFDQGATGEQLNVIQNVSIEQNEKAEGGLMFSQAGFTAPPQLGYLRSSAPLGAGDNQPAIDHKVGLNFFVDPRPQGDDNTIFHLRKVTFEVESSAVESSPDRQIPVIGQESWGCFYLLPDAITVHINGYVIGINRDKSKFQILKLPDHGGPDSRALRANMLSGEGTRAGLLDKPKLIASSASDGTFLVLEEGNQRIQAFDVQGNPVQRFVDNPETPYWTPLFRDDDRSDDITYLAMSVEVKGYAYVLSYEGLGQARENFRLDIYTPTGSHLTRFRGFNAASMVVDLWRNLYSLNYQTLTGPGGRPEPSVSEWIPDTPKNQ